jgi:hypothetical protein
MTLLARDTVFTGGGGGGGGGGGQPIVVNVSNGTWTIKTDDGAGSYIFTMSPGGSRLNKGIIFTNEANSVINLSLLCQGALCNYINLSSSTLSLPISKNYETRITFDLILPSDIAEGTYLTNIIAKDQFGNSPFLTIQAKVSTSPVGNIIDKLFSSFYIGNIKFPYAIVTILVISLLTTLFYFLFLSRVFLGLVYSLLISTILGFLVLTII